MNCLRLVGLCTALFGSLAFSQEMTQSIIPGRAVFAERTFVIDPSECASEMVVGSKYYGNYCSVFKPDPLAELTEGTDLKVGTETCMVRINTQKSGYQITAYFQDRDNPSEGQRHMHASEFRSCVVLAIEKLKKERGLKPTDALKLTSHVIVNQN